MTVKLSKTVLAQMKKCKDITNEQGNAEIELLEEEIITYRNAVFILKDVEELGAVRLLTELTAIRNQIIFKRARITALTNVIIARGQIVTNSHMEI